MAIAVSRAGITKSGLEAEVARTESVDTNVLASSGRVGDVVRHDSISRDITPVEISAGRDGVVLDIQVAIGLRHAVSLFHPDQQVLAVVGGDSDEEVVPGPNGGASRNGSAESELADGWRGWKKSRCTIKVSFWDSVTSNALLLR